MTNKEISAAYIGTDSVSKICLGTEVVWPTESGYSSEPLTINAIDQVSLQVNSSYSGGTVYYRVKGNTTWQALTPGQTLTIQPQAPVQLMGQSGAAGLFSGSSQSGHYEVYGNVMSLVHGQNFAGQTTIPSNLVDCFYATFRNCQSLVSIKNLVLPATTLSQGCYRSMFNKCWYLTELPDVFVPAEATMSSACCRYTFEALGASASTPVSVPFGFLPNVNLSDACYEGLFSQANISVSPMLPASSGVSRCYYSMFQGCYALNTIYCLLQTADPTYIYKGAWVQGVASSGTFYKAPGAVWSTGYTGIPSGWTVLDYVAPNN